MKKNSQRPSPVDEVIGGPPVDRSLAFNREKRRGFFFSSRRRHTRSLRDWSSDVCSSDLTLRAGRRLRRARTAAPVRAAPASLRDEPGGGKPCEIGRASCRERV